MGDPEGLCVLNSELVNGKNKIEFPVLVTVEASLVRTLLKLIMATGFTLRVSVEKGRERRYLSIGFLDVLYTETEIRVNICSPLIFWTFTNIACYFF